MLSLTRSWTWTLLAATLAIAFAGIGLSLTSLAPGAAPGLSAGLLLASLGATTLAFGQVAYRVRKIELENEGLIEEISQEMDRVHDKFEIFNDALTAPRSLSPEEMEHTEVASARRVLVK